ncbi:MAG TPA: HAMP domain-containing sensor histidine kinase [Terriglobales bacterium]|nr:HAMP domain-containing sensor histidine kinase [Terriglobales bacterium]
MLARLREDSAKLERGDGNGAQLDLAPAEKVEPPTQTLDSQEAGWIFDQDIPALLHTMSSPTRAEGIQRAPAWIILVLDRQTIQDLVVPALSERYFGTGIGKKYKVLFRAANTVPSVIYYSDSQHQSDKDPDLSMNIFGPPAGSTEGQFWQVARIAEPPSGAEHRQFTAPVWFPVVRYTPFDGDWNLILQPRDASSTSILQSARRRNIALSSGVLALLALSMALIVVASKRAEQLAEMQMNFVTSVSHDLRTPLAVIRTASDNLGADVVTDGQHLKIYATAIRNQTLQLTNLVEQVLLFASTRQRNFHLLLRSTPPLEAITNALHGTSALVEASGCQIDTQLDPQLPEVLADCSALSRAIQNLLSNAVNYGRESGKIAVRACLNETVNPEVVQITVTDQGPGIPQAKLSRIFEPFYRSPLAVKAGVHGTGLGLFLAKTLVESMGGRLTVKSAVGQGSSFTIHLPVVAAGAIPRAAQSESVQQI